MDPITGTGTQAAQVTCPLPVSPPRREKDALWQKTEGIDAPAPSPAPREAGLCARCHKDFRLLSRRYSCRWAPGDTRGHRGTPGDTGGRGDAVPGWHSPHRTPSSWQAVPGQGVPRVLRGRGQAGEVLPALLPAEAPGGYVSPEGGPSRCAWGHGVCRQLLAPQVLGLRCSPHGRPVERETNPVLPAQRLRCGLSVGSTGGVGRGTVARGCPSPPHGDCPLAGCPRLCPVLVLRALGQQPRFPARLAWARAFPDMKVMGWPCRAALSPPNRGSGCGGPPMPCPQLSPSCTPPGLRPPRIKAPQELGAGGTEEQRGTLLGRP